MVLLNSLYGIILVSSLFSLVMVNSSRNLLILLLMMALTENYGACRYWFSGKANFLSISCKVVLHENLSWVCMWSYCGHKLG